MEGRRFAAVLILPICMLAPGAVASKRWTRPSVCNLPAESGTGTQSLKRFYYNSDKMQCRTFIYKGNGGNDNNFPRTYDCQKKCLYRPG
uniref:Kunitz-type conkunitzin-B1 n=1 Tax=Conus bullatus TaxID=89438 RepID=VKTB1_CONBU|nr:RecName: Full=Kunitz-type conkunitzin-B1; Short=Conk-B1; Flags: Precursor [Conus bullatus]